MTKPPPAPRKELQVSEANSVQRKAAQAND